MRIAQAMLAGCLVATAPPNVEHGELTGLIVPLAPSDDAVPVKQIQAALASLSDSALDRILLNAFIFARQTFAEEARVSSVLDVLAKFKDGARGYMVGVYTPRSQQFPHQFKWTCDTDGERPPWCL